MDNKTQLQANNARIEALTEIVKNKSTGGGSGGLDINGNLKQCEAGEALEAGDFVEIMSAEEVTGITTTRSQSGDKTYQYYKIAENKYLYFHRTNYSSGVGAMLIYKQDGKWVTKNPLSAGNIYDGASYSVSYRLDATKFLICFGSGTYNYLYGTVVELVDDVLTVLKTTQISSTSRFVYSGMTAPQKLADNTFAVTTKGQTYGYVVSFTINEDYSITLNSDKSSAEKWLSNLIPLDSDNLLLVVSSNANGYGTSNLYKYTISSNTKSLVANLSPLQSANYVPYKLVKIDTDNIAMFYCKGFSSSVDYFNSPTFCIVYNITNNTTTSEVQITGKTMWTEPVLLEENKVQFVSVLSDKSVQINTITFSNGEFVNNSEQTFGLNPYSLYKITSSSAITTYPISFLQLEDGLFLNAYFSSVNTMCGLLYNIPKASKVTSSTQTISGVTSKKADAGKLLDVYVPNV